VAAPELLTGGLLLFGTGLVEAVGTDGDAVAVDVEVFVDG